MKQQIDDKILKKLGLTKSQFAYLLTFYYRINQKELDDLVQKKFYLSQSFEGGKRQNKFFVTQSGLKIVEEVFLQSENLEAAVVDRLETLATMLMEIYPEGKKEGTNLHWRSNTVEIRNRLQAFFKRFGDVPNDKMLQATREYVASFNENYTYMNILKYFIMKKKDDGFESKLLSQIENLGSDSIPEEMSSNII